MAATVSDNFSAAPHLQPGSVGAEAPPPPAPDASSSQWCGIKIIKDFSYVLGCLVAGIAARIFIPSLAPALFTIGATTLLTGLLIKPLSGCCPCINTLKDKVYEINKKYPYLRAITLIAILVLSLITPIGGAIVGGLFGVFCGFAMDSEVIRRQHTVQEEQAVKEKDPIV